MISKRLSYKDSNSRGYFKVHGSPLENKKTSQLMHSPKKGTIKKHFSVDFKG
jgi:hypothetical protein